MIKILKSPVLWFLIGILAGKYVFAQSPSEEIQACVIDCRRLPPDLQVQTRYLSLYNASGDQNDRYARATNFVVNELSRVRAITHCEAISHTLLRITIGNYAPDDYKQWSAAWDALAIRDPYWHIQTEVLANGKRKAVTTYGGWTLPYAVELQGMTKSVGPIMRADYFCSYATQPESYHAFVGIPPKEGDFLAGLGVDQSLLEKLRANAGANLNESGVTHKPRRVIWAQGPLGGVYQTLDVEHTTADKDPIRRPITDRGLSLNYDLGEWYAMGPNGLWRMALYNAKGERQDTVPDKVAKDESGDGIIYNNQSCVVCHVEGGLRPFVDDETKLLKLNLLGSYDYKITQRAKEFYDESRLQRQMSFDRQTYEAACQECTGLSSKDLATVFKGIRDDYLYKPVTTEVAARECGTSVKEFKAALVNSRDPVILALIGDGTVIRDRWTSSFAEAMLAVEARSKQ